jgi:RNA polymerase sigma factor for flagellar operon FliA
MDELIESHLGYAHGLAANLAGKYPPNITRADLQSAAELGLVQAARSYDPSKCVSFSTFAYYRVRGAIFDEVRKLWQATHVEGGANNHTAGEVAQPEPQAEADAWHGDAGAQASFGAGGYLVSLESGRPENVPSTTETPVTHVLKEEEAEGIREALRQLPKRHRFVLHAYYYEDLSLVSIGKKLNLSKSWVSRIHGQALSMVRNILQDAGRAGHRKPAAPARRRNTVSHQATLRSSKR